MYRSLLILAALSGAASGEASAYELGPEAIFHRCFAQLAQERPARDNALLQSVVKGQVGAIEACLALLKSAELTADGSQSRLKSMNANGLAVLRTMHNLHASWFSHTSFPDFADSTLGDALGDLYDTSSPAMYVTRALLRPGTPYASVTTQAEDLVAIRSAGEPTMGAVTRKAKGSYVLSSGVDFAATGDLLGFEPADRTPISGTTFVQGNSFGGGILGSAPYLLATSPGSLDFKLDGAVGTLRRYSKAVLKDLMCLDLPALREEDAKPFVDPQSLVPFRTTAGCTGCHATLDQMAGVVRNLTYKAPASSNPQVMRGVFVDQASPSEAAVPGWPSTVDPAYQKRPATGVLYYRDHAGNLVNLSLDGVASLGQALADQDTIYICAAKRYYRYFLGVDVDVGDPGNPARLLSSEGEMARHRRNVIRIGQELRKSQNLSDVIGQIMNLPEYRMSDFGQGGNP